MAEAVLGGTSSRPPTGSLVDMSLVGAEPEPVPGAGSLLRDWSPHPGTFWVRGDPLPDAGDGAGVRRRAPGRGRESDATYRRLATACLALAEQAGAEPRGADQGAWLARLEREHDNFRPC